MYSINYIKNTRAHRKFIFFFHPFGKMEKSDRGLFVQTDDDSGVKSCTRHYVEISTVFHQKPVNSILDYSIVAGNNDNSIKPQ